MKSNEVKEQAEKRKSCPKKYKFLLCEYRISKIYKNRKCLNKNKNYNHNNIYNLFKNLKQILYLD